MSRVPRTIQSTYDKDRDGVVESVPTMPAQADSVAIDVATLVADFNSLLQKLRDAGYLEN